MKSVKIVYLGSRIREVLLMYIGYLHDRKLLGYPALKDTSCGIKLVLITDSTVLLIRNLPLNLKIKSKRIIIVVTLVSTVWFSNVQPSPAMGLSIPPRATPVGRVQPSYQHPAELKIAPTVNPRLDKIYLMPNKEMIPLIYLNAKNVYINERVLKRLRAGGFEETLVLMAIGVIVFLTFQLSGTDGFAILEQFGKLNAPTVDPGFGLNPTYKKTPSALEITRPTTMPHQEFVGLTKAEKRQVSHHHDKIIHVEGHPRLRVGFWQCRFKVRDHGAVHGLPYTVKENGSTQTENSNDNTLAMIQSIVDMPHRPNAIWFDQDNVTYQGGTDREFPAVHIFDDDTKVVAVFNKQTGNFVTTCQLTEKQETELKATHNFGGGEGWFSGKVNNLPPKGITPINSFENDVMGITPVDDSQIDNSNN